MKKAKTDDFDFSILKELRATRGISLQKLSKKIAISYATLARIESNKHRPSLKTIKCLADWFEMSPAHLLELTTSNILEKKNEHKVNLKPAARRAVSFSDVLLRIGTGKAGEHATKAHQHLGHYQITWVLEGKMIARIHSENHELEKGQAIKFDASFAHSVRFIEDSKFVVAILPKRFK